MSTELIVGLVAGGVGCLGGNYRESARRLLPPPGAQGGNELLTLTGRGSRFFPYSPPHSIPQEFDQWKLCT
jgi:hypothetical protein